MQDQNTGGVARILTDHEVSRKAFLKGGGALVVGLTAVGSAQAINNPGAGSATHTGAVPGPPSTADIDTWLDIAPNNTVTVYAGWADLGQGTPTAVLQIVAEELELSMSQLKYNELDTNTSVSAGTFGSGSTRSALGTTGNAVRPAAAAAKKLLLAKAATQLGVPAAQLTVKDGVVSGGGKTVTYGDLIGGKTFGATIASQSPRREADWPSSRSSARRSRASTSRTSSAARPSSPTTCACPGWCTAASSGPAARARSARARRSSASTRARSRTSRRTSQIVQYGNFLGVVAPLEYVGGAGRRSSSRSSGTRRRRCRAAATSSPRCASRRTG